MTSDGLHLLVNQAVVFHPGAICFFGNIKDDAILFGNQINKMPIGVKKRNSLDLILGNGIVDRVKCFCELNSKCLVFRQNVGAWCIGWIPAAVFRANKESAFCFHGLGSIMVSNRNLV